MNEQSALPLLVEPDGPGSAPIDALIEWIDRNRAHLHAKLHEHGALLFRGFDVGGATAFRLFCESFGSPLLRYVGGHSPRTRVEGGVYTSTEIPPHREIPLHNEMSYAASWPSHVFFWAERAAATGGETPLADGRELLRTIDPAVVQRFRDREVLYVENLEESPVLGKSWRATFETDDRAVVEAKCAARGIEHEWRGTILHLRQRRPAIIEHPGTGEDVWFSQADLWHVSALPERNRVSLRKLMSEDELPQHAWFGDGSAIHDADIAEIRRVGRECEVAFAWEAGDLLAVDNNGALHGRRRYSGERRLLAAMSVDVDGTGRGPV